MIATTYVVVDSVRESLAEAVTHTGVKANALAASAMEMLLQSYHEETKGGGGIAYQERTPRGSKKRVHFSLGEMEYEFFNDMRKFFRKSISFLIAIAVRKYLPIIVERILNKVVALKKNNYPLYKYAIRRKCIENNVFWLIYWGLPPE